MRDERGGEGLWGSVYKGREEEGTRHAKSLGFKHEMGSALREKRGINGTDHIESNLARRLSVASNVLDCLAAAACVNVKQVRSLRASSAGPSPPAAELSTALSFRFNSRSAHRSPTRQRRPTTTETTDKPYFGTFWSSDDMTLPYRNYMS